MTPGMMTVNYRAPEMTQSENSTRCDGEQRWWPAMFINGPINPKQHRRHGEEYGGRGRLSIIDQLGVCPVDFEDMLRMLHRDQTAFCIWATVLNAFVNVRMTTRSLHIGINYPVQAVNSTDV
jgi:hypothetical protein